MPSRLLRRPTAARSSRTLRQAPRRPVTGPVTGGRLLTYDELRANDVLVFQRRGHGPWPYAKYAAAAAAPRPAAGNAAGRGG